MSRFNAPRVAGVAGGVGTTTVSTALRAHDRGRDLGDGVEVLTCRSTGDSLLQAASMVSLLAAQGWARPVLAVTADVPTSLRGPLRARLRMIEPQVSGLVVMPYVARWRELSDPLTEVASLLDVSPDELPKPLRDYLSAVKMLAGAVLRNGQLSRAQPQAHQAPRPPGQPQRQARQRPSQTTQRPARRYVAYRLAAEDEDHPEFRVSTNGGHP